MAVPAGKRWFPGSVSPKARRLALRCEQRNRLLVEGHEGFSTKPVFATSCHSSPHSAIALSENPSGVPEIDSYSTPMQVVEIPLLGQGGVARSAGVVRPWRFHNSDRSAIENPATHR